LFGAGALLIGERLLDTSEPSASKRASLATASGDKGVASFVDFGGVGDGSTNNEAAWRKISEWASLRHYAGNTPKIRLPPGRYVSSSMPNLAINRLHIECDGEVWLINIGRGPSFILDGGRAGAGIYGLKITGWPQIYGGPTSSHGIYARGIFDSDLEFNCRSAGTAGAGFYGEWLVDNRIRFIMSTNEGGLTSSPSKGVHLTRRDTSEETSYNDLEIKVSGMNHGIFLEGALGNNFRSGSVQNCRLGLETTNAAWDNKFWGTDFESNALDFRDRSRRLSLHGCDVNTKGEFASGSTGARVFGGRIESIAVDAGAKNVLLSGTAFNRAGSGRIIDAGTGTRYRDILNITEESVRDGKGL